jgi:DNA-binding CsgD family transcriptional regulator
MAVLDIVNLASTGSPIRDRAEVLRGWTCHEILALDPGGADDASLFRDAVSRGAVVRLVVCDPAGLGQHAGVTIRTAATLPARLVVLDRSRALVSTADTAAENVLVTDRGLVALLCAMFERIWVDARPFDRPSDGLTDQQSTALRLLADGHTDEAIAKRLGVSARTVRRMVTGLMTRLGARGRFQAGVHAVQAGWLPERPANPGVGTTG